jgi:hypothetical protein
MFVNRVSVACCKVEVSCDGPITRPEESYRLWCVIVCDRKTSRMRMPWPALGCSATSRERERDSVCVVCVVSNAATHRLEHN